MTRVANRAGVVRDLVSNPDISYSDVARKYGISRERVRTIANEEELKGVAGVTRRRGNWCKNCGKALIWSRDGWASCQYKLCKDCWQAEKQRRKQERFNKYYVEFTCDVCGTVFYRKVSAVKRAMTRNARPRFCTRKCWHNRARVGR